MNWREKLADWFTCGNYRRMESGEYWADEFIRARNALREIAAIHVTPESNGTLRKAVRLAREALK